MNDEERQQFEELEEERNGQASADSAEIEDGRTGQDEDDEMAENEEQEAFDAQSAEAEERKRQGAKPRISPVEGILMVLAALTFDGGQFIFNLIPILGIVISIIIDIIAWGTFFLWLKMKGISFGFSAKFGRTHRSGGGQSMLRNPLFIITCAFGVELIPILNALPAWTLAIVVTILVEYAAYALAKTGLAKAV